MTGDSTICPNEVGLYKCTVTGGNALRWIINGAQITFAGTQPVGSVDGVPGTEITAYLVEKTLEREPDVRGNRTSILRYEADFDNGTPLTIACDEGILPSCSMDVLVVGELRWWASSLLS